MVKAFKGTVHVFMLNDKERKVVDPRSIPREIHDALCVHSGSNWLSSIHYDLTRQGWRDMRNAIKKHTFTEQNVSFDGTNLAWT